MATGLGAIAETIQLSVTPVFLLVATGSLLNVFTGRLARVIDRSRALMEIWSKTEGQEHERVVAELRVVDRRIDVINNSIAAAVACGIVVCLLVRLLPGSIWAWPRRGSLRWRCCCCWCRWCCS